MTIASKFFYCRRTASRPSSRNSEHDFDPLDADRDVACRVRRSSQEEHHGRSQRRPDGPSRSGRHLVHHRAARLLLILGHRKLQESSGPNKSVNEGEGSSRIGRQAPLGVVQSSRLAGGKLDDDLPHSVLEARTRLLERLRCFHLTERRQEIQSTGTSTYGCSHNCINWKPSSASKLLESSDPVAEITNQTVQELCFHDTDKKPILLSDCAVEEVFVNSEGDETPRGFLECSICLEKFLEGEGVIRLQCGHRYHHACLVPWMECHGHCPYCRASVVA